MKDSKCGFVAENAMINALNNKRVKELNDNLKNMLERLYGCLDEDEIVKCEKMTGFYKPDFIVTYKEKRKYVSMKTGNAVTVHEEQLSTFISFLHKNGYSRQSLDTIKLYQYGDGTTDGTGEKRMNWRETYETYSHRIRKANEEFNNNKIKIYKVVDRLLFQGVDVSAEPADAIYHGDVDKGVLITKESTEKYFAFKSWNQYDALHIGPFFLKPHSRFVGVPDDRIKNEHLRHKIQINWANMKADMLYIDKYFSNNKNR